MLDFNGCAWQFLRRLECFMEMRLYMSQQVLLRQGEANCDMYILQRGECGVQVFGAILDPLIGPCIIGGMMSLLASKVFTTVIAQETVFVAKISKHQTAALFDEHPVERKHLLAKANDGFTELCDAFHEHFSGKHGLEQSLQAMPFLRGSS